jgi:hypothetical protein
MNGNSHSGRSFHRWRAPLIVVFVVPAILCAFAVKSAPASFYKAQPILCDGVDDDTATSVLCALPGETKKEFSSTKARPHATAKVFHPLTPRSCVTPAGTQLPIAFADPPLRFKRLLAQHAGSSDDPDGAH